jgi:hypothetical protein
LLQFYKLFLNEHRPHPVGSLFRCHLPFKIRRLQYRNRRIQNKKSAFSNCIHPLPIHIQSRHVSSVAAACPVLALTSACSAKQTQ